MYPAGGSHYVRHMDASKGTHGRRVCAFVFHRVATGRAEARLLTFIYYANHDWVPEHGGQLRAFLDSGPVTVEPRADRLVVFQVRACEHDSAWLH